MKSNSIQFYDLLRGKIKPILISLSYQILGIANGEIVNVTNKNVQKEIDINTEVLGIVNSEIVKVTDESVQKEIDINTEVLGIVNSDL